MLIDLAPDLTVAQIVGIRSRLTGPQPARMAGRLTRLDGCGWGDGSHPVSPITDRRPQLAGSARIVPLRPARCRLKCEPYWRGE